MSATIATVTRDASNNKFVCTINGQSIGASKYEDYFEYHYKRGDIARLNNLNIDQFQYMNDDGTVKLIKDAIRGAPKDQPGTAAPTSIKVEGVQDGQQPQQAQPDTQQHPEQTAQTETEPQQPQPQQHH